MYTCNKLRQLIGLSLCLFLTAISFSTTQAQGPGKALDFPGTTSFEHINLGDSLSRGLDTASFTLEMWINFDNNSNGDPAFIGNKDWNNGNTTGFAWVLYNTGTLRFNFKAAGGTRRDYNMSVANLQNNWNHIAMVVNRRGTLTAYLNGVQTGTPINIAADSGKTLDDVYPVRLGSDGTGAYNYGGTSRFDGKIDEVRIWKALRSETEIRNAMCRRLDGNENGLLVYYPMDDTAALSLKNFAAATSGVYNGSFQSSPVRILSGAPIGDTAVNLYTTNFAGQSLQLATPGRGTFVVDSFSGSGNFVHLYRINAVPALTGGLTPYNNNNVYYGVFTTNAALRYYPRYDYSAYDSAVAYRKTIRFFSRKYNADPAWTLKNVLYNDTAARTMRIDSVTGPRQFFLANFVGTCNNPAALSASAITYNSALLSWTTGGSAAWNIQYGPSGFTPGAGVLVNSVNTNPYLLNGLQPGMAYQYYVQDTCSGIGTSAWIGPYSFSTQALPVYHTIGAGTAIYLNASGWIDATGNNGQKATDSALGLPKKDITLEAWVKIRSFEEWRAIVSFLQDNGSFEKGWDLETGNNKKFRFALSAQNNSVMNYMESGSSFKENEWYHVAGVYNGDTMKLYVNGILEAQSTACSGNIAYASSWLSIGSYKDDNEAFSLRGAIDEVRIWSIARSQQDLRTTMCRKLKGNETGLIRYFRLDHYAGDTATELVSGRNGKLMGMVDSNWVVSGAAIGDTSIFVYNTDLSAAQLSLSSGNKGTLTVDSIANNAQGVQLYLVNNKPYYQQGISDLGTTDKYFGVFTAEDEPVPYRLKYDYASYPAAVSAASFLHLYNRKNNEIKSWAIGVVPNTTASGFFRLRNQWGSRQYLLADFSAVACAGPSALSMSTVGTTTATVAWTSSAPLHRVQYGAPGFQLGSGTSSASISGSNYQMTNLVIGDSYEVYVKDSCSNSSSAWAGPLFFTTVNPCQLPINAIADSVRMTSMVVKWTDPGQAPAFNVSWGPVGFGNPNIGIQQTVPAPRFAIGSLQPNTEYDFYIRSNCSSLSSAWAGPFTFRTDSVDQPNSTGAVLLDRSMAVYPNPAHEKLEVHFAAFYGKGPVLVSLYNAWGVCLYRGDVKDQRALINTALFPAGIYLLEATGSGERAVRRISIQH